MNLPYSDPATGGTPYFQDNTFVRGDQQRANNQRIWSNLTFLDRTPEIYNLRVAVSGNTVSLTGWTGSLSASNPGFIWIPSTATAGLVVPIMLTADISMVLPSTTPNQRICGVNTTDGQATYAVNGSPNNGVTNAIEFFAYVLYDFTSNTPYFGLNKSPLLKVLAADYLYGATSSTISKAGSGDTAWNAMITSNSTTFATPSSVGCICIGAALTMTVNGSNGTGAGACGSIAIQSGYAPMWNHRIPKVISDVFVYNGNAFGSTDTNNCKFATIATNTGPYCQYFSAGGTVTSGGTGGAEILATVSGFYHIVLDHNNVIMMITKNTRGLGSMPNIISNATQNVSSSFGLHLSNYVYLTAGDVIRFYSSTSSTDVNGFAHMIFTGFELT